MTALVFGDASADKALVPTAIKTGAYTAGPSDFVPVDVSGGSVTITLPTAPVDRARVAVKLVKAGGASTVTVAGGGATFNDDSSTSLTLKLLNQAVIAQYDLALNVWYIQSDDLPLSQLDLRYAPAADHGGVFGDGSDGAVTFDGSTTVLGLVPSSSVYTMTRDILCTAITVNNGVTLKPAGYRIFCQGTVTSNGTISNNGNNASGSTAGAATASGTTTAGTAGGAGGTGVSGSGAGSTALTSPGAGAGGNGGAGTSGAAGTAGAVTGGTHTEIYRSSPAAVVSQFAGVTFGLAGGTGGGGGGSDASSNAGGGGGGAGGMIMIAAWAVNNGSGTISAAGGNGASAAGGNAGGGGGGGGGVILIYTLSAWTAGTTAVTGGTHGTHAGTGSDGSNGGNGTVLNVVVA